VIDEAQLITSGQEGAKNFLHILKYGVGVKFEKERVVKLINLFDFKNLENNEFIFSRQVHFRGKDLIIPDILLYINGIPFVDIECKDPTSLRVSWEEGYNQIKREYENLALGLFKYIQIGVSFAEKVRYFPIVPWQKDVSTYLWREDGSPEDEAIFHSRVQRHHFRLRAGIAWRVRQFQTAQFLYPALSSGSGNGKDRRRAAGFCGRNRSRHDPGLPGPATNSHPDHFVQSPVRRIRQMGRAPGEEPDARPCRKPFRIARNGSNRRFPVAKVHAGSISGLGGDNAAGQYAGWTGGAGRTLAYSRRRGRETGFHEKIRHHRPRFLPRIRSGGLRREPGD